MLKIAQQHLLMNAHSKITEDRYMKEETRKLVNCVKKLLDVRI